LILGEKQRKGCNWLGQNIVGTLSGMGSGAYYEDILLGSFSWYDEFEEIKCSQMFRFYEV